MSQVLVQAGHLKPEIRLIQAISEFERDLTAEQKDELRRHKGDNYSNPEPVDVMRLTAQIDRTLSSQGARQVFGPRMTNFLDGVQKFVSLGDLLIGGSQGMVGRGIWHLVRVSLLSAVECPSMINDLSRILMDIGRSIPRYKNMASLFPQSAVLQNHMIEYFVVVVKLCHKVLSMSRITNISWMFSAFSSPLIALEKELQSWADAIKDEVAIQSTILAKTESAENSSYRALTAIDKAKADNRRRVRLKHRIMDACTMYDHQTAWKQTRKRGNTLLFKTDSKQLQWRSAEKACTLVYSGSLGSGKTVLLANLVDDLHLDSDCRTEHVVYFFCQRDEPESLKARTIIGSLARQMVDSCADSELASMAELLSGLSRSLEDIVELIKTILIKMKWRVYVIVDGLDACSTSERDKTLGVVKSLQEDFLIFFCVACTLQPDDRSRFRPKQLVNPLFTRIPDKNPELIDYISAEIQNCVAEGLLRVSDNTLLHSIQEILQLGAQGMYLWVSLFLTTLCNLPSDAAIIQALERLPEGLPAIYEMLLSDCSASSKDQQKRILQLVALARRPLTTMELREALIIEPGLMKFETTELANDVPLLLECCKGLVIFEEEELSVRLVHDSVYEFLLETSNKVGFTRLEAEKDVAQIVATYLNLGIFDTRISHNIVPKIAARPVPDAVLRSLDLPTVAIAASKLFPKPKPSGRIDVSTILAQTRKKNPTQVDLIFTNYAKKYWFRHCAVVLDKDEITLSLVKKLKAKGHKLDWSQDEEDLWSWIISNGYLAAMEVAIDFQLEAPTDVHSILCAAVMSGHVDVVERFLEYRSQTNKIYKLDLGIISYCLLTKQYQVLDHLVSMPIVRANFAKYEDQMWRTTVLFTYDEHKNDALIKLIITTMGRDLKFRNNPKGTENILNYVVENNWTGFVQILVNDANAQLFMAPEDWDDMLDAAIDWDKEAIASILLRAGLINVRSTHLTNALKAKSIGVVEVLLNEAGSEGHAWVESAIRSGNFETMKYLLRTGRARGNSRHLKCAIDMIPTGTMVTTRQYVSARIVAFLAARSDVRQDWSAKYRITPLLLAIELDNMNVLKSLLRVSPDDINVKEPISQSTPIHRAAAKGNLQILEALLRVPGINVAAVDTLGRTALSYAAQFGDVRGVRLLLRHLDHTWNEVDDVGMSPLDWYLKRTNKIPEIYNLLCATFGTTILTLSRE